MIFITPVLLLACAFSLSAAITPVSDKVTCAVPDRQDMITPDRIHLTGWVGMRVSGNESNRLVGLDTTRLLEGYRKRPGRQSWDGEHVGKWLHAATLAWVYTGDPELRKKLDYVASELAKCQMEDGYLGTYVEKNRWTEWDVWAHKYNLIGLITYMHYTGNMTPLPTCRKMGDLLCKTFGDEPGKRDIIQAGEHMGMAPTSVLEPMVLLYRFTGERRYLDFCKYILRAWEHPNGPHIISRLLTVKRVDKVGNGKAYEMLSCLNGALEYYRTTGEPQLLEACKNAWKDIVANRLYITGAASYGEIFHDNFDLPNVANVGETCVTVTWLQFNAQLLRLTGEARFAEQLEHVILNQLFGAQSTDCSAWGYYVQMEGTKPYSSCLDGHCCLSSGPRGIALIPTFAISTDADGAVINIYDAGTANLTLRNGTGLTLKTKTLYPGDSKIAIVATPSVPGEFSIKVRIPAWCDDAKITVNNNSIPTTLNTDGYVKITRKWKKGDHILLDFPQKPRIIVGDHLNAGKLAFEYGPLVLAADNALLTDLKLKVNTVKLAGKDLATLDITPEPAPTSVKTWDGARVFKVNGVACRQTSAVNLGAPVNLFLIPFADAGATKTQYRVWLPLNVAFVRSNNLLMDNDESRSRHGNVTGFINDDNPKTFVVTYNFQPAKEDWFAINLDAPITIKRVVFMHGQSFHDGGWFDASVKKPQIQVKRQASGDWETLGELKDYPATTATDNARLQPGQAFTLKLQTAEKVIAVRVVGVPAHGDEPRQAFSSCAELQAFSE